MKRAILLALATAVMLATAASAGGNPHEAGSGMTQKELDRNKKEIRYFASLLDEMGELRLPREMDDFWQINTELQIAMKREHEQCLERLTRMDRDCDPADRMRAMIRESNGLERWLAVGDLDVLPRYRHVLGEFLEVMREEEKAAAATLAAVGNDS